MGCNSETSHAEETDTKSVFVHQWSTIIFKGNAPTQLLSKEDDIRSNDKYKIAFALRKKVIECIF